MNITFKVQISQCQPGRCLTVAMWHGSRRYGNVDSIF
jgi:hypothetical protein